jgi:oligopeptide transport system substrate-binding protein
VKATAAGLALVGLGGTSTLLSACGQPGGGGADGEKRILKLQIDGEPSSLDVNYAFDGNSNQIVTATTAALFRIDKDNEVVPDLVDTYTKASDGLSYTFVLKDTKWTSGSPLTAHDFVFSWKRLVDPDGGFGNAQQLSAAGILNAAEIIAGEKPASALGVEALDDKTLKVTLDHPVPYVERIFRNTNVRPIEQAFFEAQGSNWGTSPETHNSCGPYKLSVYQAATPSIQLAKNPDYYDAESIPFDEVHYQVITDAQQALLSFQNGDLDILELRGDQVELFGDDPTFYSVLRPQLFYIALNTRLPGLDSPKLRRALGLSIDKDYLVSNILKNGSIPAYYFVPWDFAFDSKGEDFRDVGGTYQQVDREEALRLWNEVKEEAGSDAFTFSVVLGEDNLSQTVAQYVQAQVQETLPGITLELKPVPDKVWYEELEAGEWGLDNDWWWGEYPDAVANLMMFTSYSPYNFSGYGNDEYDAIIHDADVLPLAAKEQERIQALIRAEEIILKEETALLPLYQAAQGYLSNPELDVPYANGYYVLEDISIRATPE